MKREELLAEIQRTGGTVEPVTNFCQFQTFGKSFLDFCLQPTDSPYRVNLGSQGGPAVVCNGLPRLKGARRTEVEGKEFVEPEYEEVEPCPFKGDGRVLGWKIMLPAEGEAAPEGDERRAKGGGG